MGDSETPNNVYVWQGKKLITPKVEPICFEVFTAEIYADAVLSTMDSVMKKSMVISLAIVASLLSGSAMAKSWDEFHSDNKNARHSRHQSEKNQVHARHDRAEQDRKNYQNNQHNRRDTFQKNQDNRQDQFSGMQDDRQDSRNQRQSDRHDRIDDRLN